MGDNEKILTIPFQRRILINQSISEELIDVVTQKIFDLNVTNSEPIMVAINSNGGKINAAFALYDIFRFFSKAPIIGLGLGKIYSSGLIPLLGCKEKYCLSGSFFYFHAPEFETKTKIKDNTNLDEYKAFLLRHQENLINEKKRFVKLILENSKLPENMLDELMKAGAFVGAEEALRTGLVDKIISNEVTVITPAT